MAIILNIETSSKICSVALSQDGMTEYQLEDTEGMKHAERLAPFIEKCMEEANRKEMKIDAVAVSIGPGSYTGLRIGLALAKGLCEGLGVPLIGVSTLQILAVKAMFRTMDWTGEEILVPMIDARRMEVFTGAYNFALKEVMTPRPMILDNNSFADLLEKHDLWFMGDATEKAKTVITSAKAHWIDGLEPHARDMVALSERALRNNDFLDTAYSVPQYLKEHQATVPKNKVLNNRCDS